MLGIGLKGDKRDMYCLGTLLDPLRLFVLLSMQTIALRH